MNKKSSWIWRVAVVVLTLAVCLFLADKYYQPIFPRKEESTSQANLESTSQESQDEDFIQADLASMPALTPDQLNERARSDRLEPSSNQTRHRLDQSSSEEETDLKIALTFDDGPHPDYTPQVLDILAKHNVKATFFVLGANVDSYPDLAKRIVDEGHIIANHTYSHPDLSTFSDDEVIEEIQKSQEAIKKATGQTPDLYRLPYGRGGARVVRLLRDELGMTSIIWNMDSQDWMSQDSDIIVQTTFDYLLDDGVLLMHDIHPATPPALDQIIPRLKEMGYDFVSPTQVDFDMRYYAE